MKANVANILLFSFCEQKFVQHGPVPGPWPIPLTSPCTFWKKNGPIIPLDQNPHQTVIRFGCVGCLRPKCDNFVCLHTRQDQNELHLKR